MQELVFGEVFVRDTKLHVAKMKDVNVFACCCLVIVFILLIEHLPNSSCLGQLPHHAPPLALTNPTQLEQPFQEYPTNLSQALFNCQQLKRSGQQSLASKFKSGRLSAPRNATNASRRVLEEQDDIPATGEYLQAFPRNKSAHSFQLPQVAELVVQPSAAPPDTRQTLAQGSTNLSQPLYEGSSLNASKLDRRGEKPHENWQPISKRKPSDNIDKGHNSKPGTESNLFLQITTRPMTPNLFGAGAIMDEILDRKYINFTQLKHFEQIPTRQRRFLTLNGKNQLPTSNNQAVHPLAFDPILMKDLQESAQTPNVHQSSPLSQYLLQKLLANQQVGAQQNRRQSTAGLAMPLSIEPNQFASELAALPQPDSSALQLPQNLVSPLMTNPLLGQTNDNLLQEQLQRAQKLDIGQDGSSMVTFSLVPQNQATEQQQHNQASPLGRPDAASSTYSEQTALNGLSQEQLMAALAQLGQQPTSAPQQPVDSTSQQLQQLVSSGSVDSALITLFDQMLKGNANQPQAQAQTAAAQANNQQEDTLSQQQKPVIAQLAATLSKQQLGNKNQTHLLELQQQQLNEIKFPQSHLNEMSHQQQMPMYPLNSQQDPTYSQIPKRRPKKKRKKTEKSDSGRNPVVRVSKRPRAGPQQQFYEHNSPNDLQPSATFHKWKYPWLYRPPYDEDEDEEEGETEINLRFFNNFSRMGPFQGIARTAAPATFIISLVFLILSNVSLAATVIVHGISTFLRSLSQQQQPSASSSGPNKVSSRLARLITYEHPARDSHFGRVTVSSSTTPQPLTRVNGTSTSTVSPSKRTRLDQMIRSFSNSWKSEF